ncbi:uncharacterized protein [Coffea arabica]|uniref:Protein enabled homolog n=1 Tax=Coffea arabica TaxID=13443 RepID=A0ABM4VM50_COFAR
MESQRGPLLNWPYFYQGKGMDELRQSLLLTTMELENTRLKAQEELKMRDDQLFQLKDLLSRTIKERDEAQEQCQRLVLDKLLLQQQQLMLQRQNQQSAPLSGISSIEDEPRRGGGGMDSNNGFSSSDYEESIVSSPIIEQNPPQELTHQLQVQPQHPTAELDPTLPILTDRPLPEKGQFLQAVMKAGPLLQTLLLAGPLPQRRHPPPPLDSYQIPPPPVVVPPPPTPPTLSGHSLNQDSLLTIAAYNSNINNCGRMNRKRGYFEGSDSSTEAKYQRLVLQ